MTEQQRNDAMCQTQTSRMTLEFYRAAQGATLEGHASPPSRRRAALIGRFVAQAIDLNSCKGSC
jgi:hypothetical protein